MNAPHPEPRPDEPSPLATCIREIAEFVDASGWGQAPQLFALVPTALVAAAAPELTGELSSSALTPVQQQPLPDHVADAPAELREVLGTVSWPESVEGCALVQEILVLPPDAESDLDFAAAPVLDSDPDVDSAVRTAAESHPQRRDARLIAAATRDGRTLCLMHMRPLPGDPEGPLELLQYRNLAAGLAEALLATFG